MNNYQIQPVGISADIISLLSGFYCGLKLMDEILHSQGLLSELHTDNPMAYCVYNEQKLLVGFCIAGQISLPYETDGGYAYVDMVDIACLAVHKDFQYRGIGTAILDYICKKADIICSGADFIHVDALDLDDGSYSAVPFYQKYGFSYCSRSGEDAARMLYALYQ